MKCSDLAVWVNGTLELEGENRYCEGRFSKKWIGTMLFIFYGFRDNEELVSSLWFQDDGNKEGAVL